MKTLTITELSVTQYAKQIGLTRQAVLAQIADNRLSKNVKAKKIGNNWIINIVDIPK